MIEFLQSYSFVLKHGSGKSNKVVDALIRRTMILNTMSVEVVSLNCMKSLYEGDADFSEAWKACKKPWSWITHHIWTNDCVFQKVPYD